MQLDRRIRLKHGRINLRTFGLQLFFSEDTKGLFVD